MPTIGRIAVAVVLVALIKEILMGVNILGTILVIGALIYIWLTIKGMME